MSPLIKKIYSIKSKVFVMLLKSNWYICGESRLGLISQFAHFVQNLRTCCSVNTSTFKSNTECQNVFIKSLHKYNSLINLYIHDD